MQWLKKEPLMVLIMCLISPKKRTKKKKKVTSSANKNAYPKRCPSKPDLWIITSFKFQVFSICVLVHSTPIVGIKIVPVAGHEVNERNHESYQILRGAVNWWFKWLLKSRFQSLILCVQRTWVNAKTLVSWLRICNYIKYKVHCLSPNKHWAVNWRIQRKQEERDF